MKSFIFKNVWMLSQKDMQGNCIEFHEKKNLVQGRNHTGKSSLIKTLFLTLGARPEGNLQKWDSDTISLVDFEVGSQRYRALHQQGMRALFTGNNELIISTGDHSEWSEALSLITGFNLVLSDKKGNSVPADPRCFFLPFYINQDGSWQSGWNTFSGLQQFSRPVGAILEYFSGIKPPAFYDAKAKRDTEQRMLNELYRERDFLKKAQGKLDNKLSMSGVKINPDNFQREIEELTSKINELNKHQEVLRERLVKDREILYSINLQIKMTDEALRSYEGDAEYLRNNQKENLICPTCNAEHEESFFDLLTYADDARSIRDITARLCEDGKTLKEKIAITDSEIVDLDKQYKNIYQLLETKKGDMKFGQIIESLGAEQAHQAFFEQRESLEQEIGTRSSEVEKYALTMKELTDRKRSAAIQKRFREAFASSLFELNMPPSDKKRPSLSSRPSISGSGGPRSVLAYYAAIWNVCLSETGSFSIPLVVDSPNQQGQDDINLPKVIEFVSTKLPDNTQLILGSEIDVDFTFDKKILLDRPYQLLDKQLFAKVENEIEPLMAAMYSATRTT